MNFHAPIIARLTKNYAHTFVRERRKQESLDKIPLPGKNARYLFYPLVFSFSLDRYDKYFFLLLAIRSVKRSEFARESIF